MFADHPIALPAWVDPYLNALEETGLEHTAAAMARTTVRAVRKLASDSAEFAYALEEALERATDKLEAEARRRAVEGIEKGIYFEGERVATERVYSDSLMALFLKGKRRRQFGDKTEVSGPGGAPLTISIRKFSQDPEPIDVSLADLAPALSALAPLAYAALAPPTRPADITPHALSTVTADDLL